MNTLCANIVFALCPISTARKWKDNNEGSKPMVPVPEFDGFFAKRDESFKHLNDLPRLIAKLQCGDLTSTEAEEWAKSVAESATEKEATDAFAALLEFMRKLRQ